jgi:hypothetical protein
LAYPEDHCSAKRRKIFSLGTNEADKVNLTAAWKNDLLTLQQTASLTNTIQNRLATEQRVSSALDDPTAFFFAASSLNNRAVDIIGLKDSILSRTAERYHLSPLNPIVTRAKVQQWLGSLTHC